MIINDSHIEAALEMSTRAREKFIAAIVEYSALGIEPEGLPREAAAAWKIAKKDIDNARAKAEAGRQGGLSRASGAEAGVKQTCKQSASSASSKRASKTQADAQAESKQSAKQNPSRAASKAPSKTQQIEKEKEMLKTIKEDIEESPPLSEKVAEVIEHLNQRAGACFRPTTASSAEGVTARLREGYSVDDLKAVIDAKCDEWGGSDMARYLRPSTLFRPSHFEGYLSEARRRGGSAQAQDELADLESLAEIAGGAS